MNVTLSNPLAQRTGFALFFTLLLLPAALAFTGLIQQNTGGFDFTLFKDPYLWQIINFTLKQSFLSALLSTVIALPIAWSVYKLPAHPLKTLFLEGSLLCFVAPTLVVVTGLVALLGRSGSLTPFLNSIGLEHWNLYGLPGILLAHIFLNTPYALRAFYAQLNTVSDTSLMLSRQLKLTPLEHFQTVEWPAIKAVFGQVFGFIFILCFNSFAVVLALGGGPKSTTLEVAIFQALKYDFNIPEALMLSWSQLLIAGGLYFLFTQKAQIDRQSIDRPTPFKALAYAHKPHQIYLAVFIGVITLIWMMPLWSLFSGFKAFIQSEHVHRLLNPTLITLSLGTGSALISVLFAYLSLKPVRSALLQGKVKRATWVSWLTLHSLYVPAMVISVGIFIALLGHIDLERYGLVVITVLNGFLLMPFAFQRLRPALVLYDQQNHTLIRSLKLTASENRRLEWRYIRSTVKSAFGLVWVFAMGDVALFAIFGPTNASSLPWLIYSLAGSYQITAASGAAVCLLLLCAAALMITSYDRGQNRHVKD